MSTEIAIPSAPSGVSTFTFDGHTIRVVEIEGEPWFVAVDVVRALYAGYDTGQGATRYTASLGKGEVFTLTMGSFHGQSRDQSLRHAAMARAIQSAAPARKGPPNFRLVSESGLYKLILRANASPTATAFQNWVTRDVLPTIRKSGAYVAGQETLAPAQQAEMATMVADLVARMGVLLDREESRQKAVGWPLTGNYGSPLPTQPPNGMAPIRPA